MTSSLDGRTLLVVVAHPDDETFGCGSLIASAVAAGAQVTVCCATRGEAGEPAPECDLGDRTLDEVRVQELREAARMLGSTEPVVLDFVDSGMAGDTASDTLVGAPFDSLVAAVHEVIDRARPDVVVSLDPSGGDGHRDHARIAQATIEAFRRWGGHASLYSWCIPRSLLQRWLDRLAETRPGSRHLEFDQTELGRPDDEITTIIDVRAHLPLRRRAMQVHASQQSPFADMPDDLVDAFLGFDRLVRVEPSWQGGPIESALFVPAPSSSTSSGRS